MRKAQLLANLSTSLIVIALGGCATRGAPPASLDSPSFQLDLGRQAPSGQPVLSFTETQPLPAGDQIHVTITDSAGNTLYDRLPSLDQTYKVPLPADGKLYVTTHWSGGPPTRQELVHPVQKGAANQVVIRWDKNAKSYTTAAPPVQLASEPRQVEPIAADTQRIEVIRGGSSALYGSSRSGVILSLGYGEQEAPSVDFGTLIPGGPGSQVAAVKSKYGVSGTFAGLRLETPWGYAEVEYFNGDKTVRALEPVGGASVGFVYNQPNANNSFGLNTGPNGGNFEIKAEVTRYGARYAFPYAFHESPPEARLDQSEIRPLLHFGRTETKYSGRAQSINFPDIWTTTDQRVNENRYGIGIVGQHTRKLTDSIVGRFMLDLDLLYRKADLSSRQDNVCGAPGCSPANTFTASNSDSDSGFTWGAGFGTSLEYSFAKNSSLGLEFGYRYLYETAALKTPTSTIDIDGPPHLQGHSVHSWRVGGRYRYEW